jgi:serine/threonine protein kinase
LHTSKTTFLEALRKSELLVPERVEAFVAGFGPDVPAESREWADRFVRGGLLTQFQANLLLQGRYRGFYLRGKYKLLDLLGVGGMGRVFLCEHVHLNRLVAVKILGGGAMKDPATVERFYREARLVAQLDDPNVVRVYDVEPDEKMPLMVMEFVDGASLHAIVKKVGVLPVDRACHYVAQAARGLQHAHEAGLVHRDVKPGNLLLDRQGVVKVLDLGLARFLGNREQSITAKYDEKVVFGTADYLAPEQAVDSTTVDVRADVYSLGATFWYLLAGEPPFGEGSVTQKLLAHQTKPLPSIRKRRPDVPAGLEAVLKRMMAKDPADRYQVPIEVARALEPWIPASVEPPSSAELSPVSSAVSTLFPAGTATVHTPPPNAPLDLGRAAPGDAPFALRTGPPTPTQLPAGSPLDSAFAHPRLENPRPRWLLPALVTVLAVTGAALLWRVLG